MRRVLLISLVTLLLVLTVSSVVVAKRNYIVVGTTDKITSLDPAKQYDYLSTNVLQNVLVGLVNYKPGTAELVPWLAEKWDVSADGLVYTFYLKKGVKFTDGADCDANALKFSFDRAMKLGGDPSFLLTDIVKKVDVVDKYTAKVTLKYPFGAFIAVVGYTVAYPVSPKIFPANDFYLGTPPADGPYKIKQWIHDVRVILERNDSYFGTPAKTKRIVLNFYQTASTLRLALESGEVDVAYRTLNPRDVQDLEKNPHFKVYKGPSPFIRHIVFNVKKAPFDNAKIRKAIALAVDRSAIINDILAGQAAPLYTLIPIGWWGHKDVMPKRNVAEAVKILEGIGYSKSNPLKITLWYTPSHYGSTEADIAQVLASNIEETGVVKVKIKYAEWATYIDYWEHGIMGMFLLGWYPDYIDPDDYMWPFLASSASPSMGSYYSNPKVDTLLKQARKISDVAKRSELYKEVQDILGEEAPYVDLYEGIQICVTKPDIKGVLLEPTQIFRYYLLYR